MLKKGQNFRVKVDGKIVACATTCTLHLSAQLEESSTKDSTDSWTEQECVSKSWDGSVEALKAVEADTGAEQFTDIESLIGKTVEIEYTDTEGDKNRTDKASGEAHHGNAIVNDLNINAANKQNVTYSMQFTGVGALVKGKKAGA